MTVHGVDDLGRVLRLLDAAALACDAMVHPALRRRCTAISVRLKRPGMVLAVAGEYKQGKSSLINGLLGRTICPVDDDIATSRLVLLEHGDAEGASVWRTNEEGYVAEAVDFDALPDIVGSAAVGSEDTALVQVVISNSFLAAGISLVDTPGAGGLDAGFAEATLAYLPTVHGLIFVTSARAPLSLEEVGFLTEALRECEDAIVVVTKTDLHRHWREIAELDRRILLDAGLDLTLIPVSNALRTAALERLDGELNVESGFPLLVDEIAERFLERGRHSLVQSALDLCDEVFRELERRLQLRLAAHRSPELAVENIARLDETRGRLERLREGNSKWQAILNEGFSDVQSDADYRYRKQVRDISAAVDASIEDGDPVSTWDDLSSEARRRIAEAAREFVRELEGGADAVARRIIDCLDAEGLGLSPALGGTSTFKADNFTLKFDVPRPGVSSAVGTGLTALRGAQGGVLLLGTVTMLTGMAASGGILLGVAAVFGGKSLLDDRRRQQVLRRQEARSAFRRFVDEAQFEVSHLSRNLSRDLQRRLRNHFSECIADTIRSTTAEAESLSQALREDASDVEMRVSVLTTQLAEVEGALEQVREMRALSW